MGRQDIKWAIGCARTLGLRIEEVIALIKAQIREALTNGYVHLTKTKGGISRDVPNFKVDKQGKFRYELLCIK